MPPQARVGDSSQVPADVHGCPACPHPAIGPAIQGSPNVLTNGLPSVRVGDKGVHAACCGPNLWNAKTGSGSVLINGRKAHRLSDLVQHCGGIGNTVQGSPNVIVGDRHGRPSPNPKKSWIEIELVDHHGNPMAGERYKITVPGGATHEGELDEDGRARVDDIDPGKGEVSFPGLHDHYWRPA